MSALVAFSPCFGCGQVFSFNPDLVPSIDYEGAKRPICQECVDRINPVRIKMGNPLIVPLPGAYDPEVQ
jgi:hypothetical protein